MDRKSSLVHQEDGDFDCWIPNETHPKKLLEDEYLLGDVIGREALFIVYKCLRKGRTEWACKVLKKKLLDKKVVQRKIQTLLNLRHPNLVQVKDVFETRDEIQLILELADGGELFERIVQKGCYTEKDAAHAVRHVLKALQYLHSKGIVHKGVKPENILYKTGAVDLVLQLSDVGASMLMANDNYVTQGTFGTFGLLAPEILQKHNSDTSLDLWNLGVVIYVMLCGFEPFWDKQIQAVTSKKIIEGDLTFPSPSWDKVSDGAKDLIKKLLSIDPKSRLSATEALNHPWVLGTSTPSAPMTDETLIKLREFNARRRFRVATTAVIATKRALSYLPVIRSTGLEDKTVETYLNKIPPGDKPIGKKFINDFGYVRMDIRKNINEIKSSINARTTSDLEKRKLEAELKAAEEMAQIKEVVIEKRLAFELASIEGSAGAPNQLSDTDYREVEELLSRYSEKPAKNAGKEFPATDQPFRPKPPPPPPPPPKQHAPGLVDDFPKLSFGNLKKFAQTNVKTTAFAEPKISPLLSPAKETIFTDKVNETAKLAENESPKVAAPVGREPPNAEIYQKSPSSGIYHESQKGDAADEDEDDDEENDLEGSLDEETEDADEVSEVAPPNKTILKPKLFWKKVISKITPKLKFHKSPSRW